MSGHDGQREGAGDLARSGCPGEARRESAGSRLLHAQDRAAWLALERIALRDRVSVLQDRVQVLQSSIAFQLGDGLLSALRSPRGILRLPALARTLYRTWRMRGEANVDTAVRGFSLPQGFIWPGGELPAPEAPSAPTTLADLRVACVMDEFSSAVFAPECTLRQLPVKGFEPILDALHPHFLFVESAWRGLDGAWRDKIHPVSAELHYLLDCCRRRGIPTVFWNKEDPSHFANFLPVARLFEHVFTTDADCLPRYRAELGHDRVELLRFAFQPRLHHPVTEQARESAACFAGSWYAKYPERAAAFTQIVDTVRKHIPVEMFDRNAGRGDPAFEFPARFRPMIRGSLPFDQMDRAYKGYRFGITVNTVTTSPSMLARRIYELMACNTVVISNPARALETHGDLVLVSGRVDFESRLVQLRDDDDARHRLRLRALRHVFAGHTAGHRLSQVATAVTGTTYEVCRTPVHVVAYADSVRDVDRIVESFTRQAWREKRLTIITDSGNAAHLVDADIRVMADPCSIDAETEWWATMDQRDHYGPQYLTDLVHAIAYASQDVIGKDATYAWREGAPHKLEGEVYREASVSMRCCVVRAGSVPVLQLIAGMREGARLTGLAIDEFNYCEDGAGHPVASVIVE